MAALDWEFRQLSGTDRRTLFLSGYNAPFGRPRKSPVAKEVIKSRVKTTNYPGRSGRPTRQSFGINWEPMELNGRWMTKMMKPSDASGGIEATAGAVADAWRDFVQDEVACRITWGHIVSYIGYIEELELSRESEDHIAWKMKLLIDVNDDYKPPSRRPGLAGQNSSSLIDDSIEFAFRTTALKIPNIGSLSTDFLDKIDFAVRALNGPSAAINKLAGQFADIEKATFSTLGHFRSALKGFGIAFNAFRNLVMDTQIDAGHFARSAVSDIEWIQFQMDLDLHGNDILALMAAMDRKAESAQQQQFTKVIKAKSPDFIRGESWESLSIRATGTAQNAAKIRDANGGGGHAVPGETYIVP